MPAAFRRRSVSAGSEPGMVNELRHRRDDWLAKREKETGKKPPILDYEIGLDRSIGSVSGATKLQEKDDEEE